MKLSLSWRRRRNDGNFGIYAHYASRGNARQPSNSLSIRGIPYDAETNTGGVHWWTFLGAYNNLGDCTFAQVVRIRDKKARGKTLEKDEREWYRRNSDLVNIKNKLSQEEETTISTWLKLGKE